MKYLAAFLLAPLLALLAGMVWIGLNYTLIDARDGDEWLLVKNDRASECAAQGGCIVFSPLELARAMALFSAQRTPRNQGVPL